MPPNIIVFFTDDHAQWALPSYGNSELHAPVLSALAANGALLQNAFTPCPVCSPARASFWTGLYPSQHGVHDHLAEDDAAVQQTDWLAGVPTLADYLQGAAYQTALCGKWHCGAGERPKPAFDYWYSAWRKTPKYFSLRNKYSDNGRVLERTGYDTDIITEAALNFLRRRDCDRPFFLYIGYATTHNPWINRQEKLVRQYRQASFCDIPADKPYPFGAAGRHPVAPADPREARAQYYASVSMIDAAVGTVLAELAAQATPALVVYTADHGLNLGQHGLWGKGNGSEPLNMLEESIRVPLLFNHPSLVKGGQMYSAFFNHTDLFMTLLDFAGALPDDVSQYPGQSFKSLLSGESAAALPPNLYIGEYGPTRAIRDARHKLVLRYAGGENLLFDLLSDPRETFNVHEVPRYREVRDSLRARLDRFFARYEVPQHSGLRGGALPVHNRREAWRSPSKRNIA